MKLPPLPSLSQLCSSSAGAEPFDEMKLSDQQLESKMNKLRNKGYFTIPVARATRKYLKDQSAATPSAGNLSENRSLDYSYEEVATALATRVVADLHPETQTLRPQEFQIRKPTELGASSWHQDTAPKFLTCITTLEGPGTKFVAPDVFKGKFMQTDDVKRTITPIDGDAAIKDDIRTTKPDKFYFFAALGVNDPQVPKLLHRAPGQAGRSIFLARWLENRHPGEASRLPKRPADAAPSNAAPAPEPKTNTA